ncbi:hypothetical protein [Nocardioides pacificus]
MRRPPRVTALALCVALAGSACTGDSDGPAQEPDPSASSPSAEAPAFTTRSRLGKVAGRLPARERAPVVRAVTAVVEGWTNGAYLAGDYPRATFRIFPGFTLGARQEALRDVDLMSNADIGERITRVVPARQVVAVDVLARKARPVAATARLLLQFDTEGEVARRVTVRGRLMLTRSGKGGGWGIFAYDITKGRFR